MFTGHVHRTEEKNVSRVTNEKKSKINTLWEKLILVSSSVSLIRMLDSFVDVFVSSRFKIFEKYFIVSTKNLSPKKFSLSNLLFILSFMFVKALDYMDTSGPEIPKMSAAFMKLIRIYCMQNWKIRFDEYAVPSTVPDDIWLTFCLKHKWDGWEPIKKPISEKKISSHIHSISKKYIAFCLNLYVPKSSRKDEKHPKHCFQDILYNLYSRMNNTKYFLPKFQTSTSLNKLFSVVIMIFNAFRLRKFCFSLLVWIYFARCCGYIEGSVSISFAGESKSVSLLCDNKCKFMLRIAEKTIFEYSVFETESR